MKQLATFFRRKRRKIILCNHNPLNSSGFADISSITSTVKSIFINVIVLSFHFLGFYFV